VSPPAAAVSRLGSPLAPGGQAARVAESCSSIDSAFTVRDDDALDGGSDVFGPEASAELQLVDPSLDAPEVEINLVTPVFQPLTLPVPNPFVPLGFSAGRASFDEDAFVGRAVGSVHEKVGFWEKILEADKYVLGIVKYGYRIPVISGTELITYRERNNRSARMESEFVQVEVERLLSLGLAVECDAPPLCTNPLSVAYKLKPDGSYKRRLVIDLSRHINCLILDSKFRMTTFGDVLACTMPGDYQYVFDLEAAYHHCRLSPDSYKYVGFCVEFDGVERFFFFTILVFGLKPSGQVLGRVLKPLISFLAQSGVRLQVYIDDGRGTNRSKEKADDDYALVCCSFASAGFTISVEKSDPPGGSCQVKEYLGFIIDTHKMMVFVPEYKMSRIVRLLQEFLAERRQTCRSVAGMVGKLNSLEAGLGTEIYVGTRMANNEVVALVEERHFWDAVLFLSVEARDALAYVLVCLKEWNGHPIRAPHTSISLASVLPAEAEVSLDRKIPAGRYRPVRATLASDASDSAVAAYCVDGLPAFEYYCSLSESEATWSSSQRELLAFQRVVEAKGDILSSLGPITLFWLTDNQNVCKFLSKGSGRPYIMRQIFDLFKLARSLNLDIRPIWVSRDNPLLQRADGLSKCIDTDNWSVGQGDFVFLCSSFGPFTVDLFASATNAKVERFFSYSHEHECSGVDAFAADWAGEMAYAAPPVSLVIRCIRKIVVTRMTGLLLIPMWRSARFYTFAFPDGRHLASVFSEMSVVRIATVNWDISVKDAIGNKTISFLALRIASTGCGDLVSLPAASRCMRVLFGKTCNCKSFSC
jgi:hypothetical protein